MKNGTSHDLSTSKTGAGDKCHQSRPRIIYILGIFLTFYLGCTSIWKEIHRLRTTREELGRLLGRGRGGGIPDDSEEVFRPFREVSALR